MIALENAERADLIAHVDLQIPEKKIFVRFPIVLEIVEYE